MGRSRVAGLILAAAIERFAAHGYDGVSTKEIAVAAGVTEGSIFRLFRSKDRLFLAALEKSAEGSLTAVQLGMLLKEAARRNDWIRTALLQWYKFLPREHARIACFALLGEHEGSRAVAESMAALARVTAEAIEPRTNPRAAARAIGARAAYLRIEAHARGLLYALMHHKAMGAAYGKIGMKDLEFAAAQIEFFVQ